MGKLQSRSDVSQREDDRPLVIFAFSGVHDYTHGRQMDAFMRTVLRDSPADGIIIDLLDYEYVYGNDIGTLFLSGFDQETHSLVPVCMVAIGETRAGLESLLSASGFHEVDLAVVPTNEDARQELVTMWKIAAQRPPAARVAAPTQPPTREPVAQAEQPSGIDIPLGRILAMMIGAAAIIALIAQTGSTLSVLSIGVLFLTGGLLIAMNASYIIRAWAGIGEKSHIYPILGGVLVAIGVGRFPVETVRRWWWIPLIVDPGCLLIAVSFIWELTFRNRDPR